MKVSNSIQTKRDKALSIPHDIERYNNLGLLDILLKDRSTNKNIIWATSAYKNVGNDYESQKSITKDFITGNNAEFIRRRAKKSSWVSAMRCSRNGKPQGASGTKFGKDS